MTETHPGRQYTTMVRLKRPAAGLETAPVLPGPPRASRTSISRNSPMSGTPCDGRACPRRSSKYSAHDVFVVIHRRLVDFDATRAIRPWLFGISYRVASEHRRRRLPPQGARAPDVDIAEVPDQAPSPERILASDEARRRVALALEQLPLNTARGPGPARHRQRPGSGDRPRPGLAAEHRLLPLAAGTSQVRGRRRRADG